MSWIIGYVGRHLALDRRERIRALSAAPIVERRGRTYYVAAGGIGETCAGGDLPNHEGSWCVVGTGVRLEGGESRLLAAGDWRRRLSSQHPRLDRLGGGFVAVRWRRHRLEAFSDVLGLRSIYWMRAGDGFLFSTRPDWLCAVEGGLHVDWRVFGSHWLAYNQLSHRSLVEGMARLGPGGHLFMTDDEVRAERHLYVPRDTDAAEAPAALLRAQLRASDGRTVSLGLSGGMDSRTLLALRPRDGRFGVHVFGDRSSEDVEVAMAIAQDTGVPFSHFHVPPVDRDELLRLVAVHAKQTQAVSPASSALSLRYYPELRSQRKLVVDGGFGEIMRRQFMNRLIRRGAKAIREQSPAGVLERVRFERMPYFSEPAQEALEEGAEEDASAVLQELHSRLHLGLENAVDLLNVHMRLPNFMGYEQARLDTLVQTFMPYAHPRLLDTVFRIAPRRRRRGRLSRRIIASESPRLRRYPLVKGDVSYPYGLPSLVSAAYVKITKRFADATDPPDRILVLHQLKEYVMDRITSAAVRSDEIYDARRLEEMASAYYKNGTSGAQLDWWLALDLWRRAVENPDAEISPPSSPS